MSKGGGQTQTGQTVVNQQLPPVIQNAVNAAINGAMYGVVGGGQPYSLGPGGGTGGGGGQGGGGNTYLGRNGANGPGGGGNGGGGLLGGAGGAAGGGAMGPGAQKAQQGRQTLAQMAQSGDPTAMANAMTYAIMSGNQNAGTNPNLSRLDRQRIAAAMNAYGMDGDAYLKGMHKGFPYLNNQVRKFNQGGGNQGGPLMVNGHPTGGLTPREPPPTGGPSPIERGRRRGMLSTWNV